MTTFPPKTHTARRDYTCAYCGQTIVAGTPYHAQQTLDLYVVKTRRKHVGCDIDSIQMPTDHLF